MQNKHYFFFSFLGIPTFGEGGGGQAGWAKIPTFTKNLFWRLPLGEGRNSESEYPSVFIDWTLHLASWCWNYPHYPCSSGGSHSVVRMLVQVGGVEFFRFWGVITISPSLSNTALLKIFNRKPDVAPGSFPVLLKNIGPFPFCFHSANTSGSLLRKKFSITSKKSSTNWKA